MINIPIPSAYLASIGKKGGNKLKLKSKEYRTELAKKGGLAGKGKKKPRKPKI